MHLSRWDTVSHYSHEVKRMPYVDVTGNRALRFGRHAGHAMTSNSADQVRTNIWAYLLCPEWFDHHVEGRCGR